MDAINKARETADKARRDAETLESLAPFIPGNPKLFYARGIYGAIATACYKVRTIAELRELLAALPPVSCVAYRGACAGVMPADVYNADPRHAHDTMREDCDGLQIQVSKDAATGAYPCDQHAMSAKWYADTPAGRVAVRVEFHHNAREDWPNIAIYYAREWSRSAQREVETRDIGRIEMRARPPHSEMLQFASGDRKTPGSFTLWYRDAASRDLSLDTME